MVKRVRRIRFRNGRRARGVRRRVLFEQLGERRVLAAITGTVFEDFDLSLRQEAAEQGLAQRLLFVDSNNNEQLDAGEPLAFSDAGGSFSFVGMPDGDHSIRLFDGSVSQRLTFPMSAELSAQTVPVQGAVQTLATPSRLLALLEDSVVSADLATGQTLTIPVAPGLSEMALLPNGQLLVLGVGESGGAAWSVDLENSVVDPLDLFSGPALEGEATAAEETPVVKDLAVDAAGYGVVLVVHDESTAVFGIDASAEAPAVTATSVELARNSMVLASQTGPRSIIASAGDVGLDLILWSNATTTQISPEPVTIAGATKMLAFDDAAGLLALRTAGGGVSIHDVDASFAPVHEFEALTGPIALDGARELLLSLSPLQDALQLIDLRDGSELIGLPVDLGGVGTVEALIPNGSSSLVAVGAAGLAELSYQRPAAHRVRVEGEQSPGPIRFGVQLTSGNDPPSYPMPPVFSIAEDTSLTVAGSALQAGVSDADGDQIVFTLAEDPGHGTASITSAGDLVYTPEADFNGDDTIVLRLHDGRDVTDVPLSVRVTSVPDAPTGLSLQLTSIAEDAGLGTTFGSINVDDPDGGEGHAFVVSDPRFAIQGGQMAFVGGSLNYEEQSSVSVSVTLTDTDAGTSMTEQATISIADANDPITGISPTSATVFENATGDVITELVVEDEDLEQIHLLQTDDSRFVVDFGELRLADDATLDYEVEQSIVVNVTAQDVTHGDTFTQAVTVTVRNLPEQPQVIGLDGDSVMELEPGDEVGKILVDGVTPSAGYTFTIDDGRFEIADGRLKLLDNLWVERSTQTEIQVEVSVQDVDEVFAAVSETFTVQVVENDSPFHNEDEPYDVNGDDEVTVLDALTIINFLNTHGSGPVGPGDPGVGLDINGDGIISPLDALLVINDLGRQRRGTPVTGPVGAEAEGTNDGTGSSPQQISGGEGEERRIVQPRQIAGFKVPEVQEERFGLTDEAISEYELGVKKTGDLTTNRDVKRSASLGRHTVSDDVETQTSGEFQRAVDETVRLLTDRTS